MYSYVALNFDRVTHGILLDIVSIIRPRSCGWLPSKNRTCGALRFRKAPEQLFIFSMRHGYECLAHLVEWCKILSYNRYNFRIKITTKSFNESYFIHCFILVLWAYRKKSYPIDIETFMVRRCHCAQTKNGPYFKYASIQAGTGEGEVCKLDVRVFQAKCKKIVFQMPI